MKPSRRAGQGPKALPLRRMRASRLPRPGGPEPGFPFDVTGKGDAAVRDLNQEELDRIAKQRR